MEKKSFILVCKTSRGTVYVCPCLIEGSELQGVVTGYNGLGVEVVDVLPVDIDLSKYEY